MPSIYQLSDGRVVGVIERSGQTATVEMPPNGGRTTVPVDQLHDLSDPFATLGTQLPTSLVEDFTLSAQRSRGVVLYVFCWGPVTVKELLAVGEWCERECNGVLAELRVAGCLESATMPGADFAVTDAVRAQFRS
ncbi:DUF7346 family protein [Halocatena halophila]|uniref:DUF7346 family protein n=1 Tax=Halocatena halophila TaxID=2814576 RepID=UPI002ED2F2D7